MIRHSLNLKVGSHNLVGDPLPFGHYEPQISTNPLGQDLPSFLHTKRFVISIFDHGLYLVLTSELGG